MHVLTYIETASLMSLVYACGSTRVYQLGRPRFFPDTGDGQLSSCLKEKTPNGCPSAYNLR